jgi:hypothetical protein
MKVELEDAIFYEPSIRNTPKGYVPNLTPMSPISEISFPPPAQSPFTDDASNRMKKPSRRNSWSKIPDFKRTPSAQSIYASTFAEEEGDLKQQEEDELSQAKPYNSPPLGIEENNKSPYHSPRLGDDSVSKVLMKQIKSRKKGRGSNESAEGKDSKPVEAKEIESDLAVSPRRESKPDAADASSVSPKRGMGAVMNTLKRTGSWLRGRR